MWLNFAIVSRARFSLKGEGDSGVEFRGGLDRSQVCGYLRSMNQIEPKAAGESFILPLSARGATKPFSSLKHLAEKSFIASKMASADSHLETVGLERVNPKNRGEAKRAVERGMDQAVIHYSDPERLAELGDHLRYLLPFYGAAAGKMHPLTQADREQRFKNAFPEKGDRAVHTQMLVDIYNGSVARLRKAAEKSGNNELLKLGEGDKEITFIPRIKKLEDEYHAATTRDKRYIYTLEPDKDGKFKAVRKDAPTFGDWSKDTMAGLTSSGTHEEAMGYLLGRSLKSLVKLVTPGAMELHQATDVRAGTAKMLEQLRGVGKTSSMIKAGSEKKEGARLERPAAGVKDSASFPGRSATFAI